MLSVLVAGEEGASSCIRVGGLVVHGERQIEGACMSWESYTRKKDMDVNVELRDVGRV